MCTAVALPVPSATNQAEQTESLTQGAVNVTTAAQAVRSSPTEENCSCLIRLATNRAHTLRAITAILPLVGFLGTVAGLSNSLIGASGVSSENAAQRQTVLQAMEIALGTAFDKSMLGFAAATLCTLAERWMMWRIHMLPQSLREPIPKG